jgi:3-dehydroquinate dehydratase/shikimate dehydrogenase
MEELLHLEPPFFDLEYDMNSAFLFKVLQKYKKTKIILSYHNFEETPQDLLPIYQAMTRFSAYGYKIATFSRSSNDALRMLVFAKNHDKVSVICMGEKGQFARVLGPVCGNLIDYASLEDGKATAPGQMSVCDLIDVYGYLQRSSHTKLYGLIGDPVEKSLGHLYHNGVFRSKGLDCVYVKMQVASEELAEFFPLATNMGFQGLSVTMPLKEKVIPFLSAIDPSAQSIRAINTLIFRNNQWIGINTDGIGALDAIEKKRSVFEKKIVIIGAGGAARAIVFEALRRGADVCIANRTLQKAQELAREMGCQAVSLSDIPSFYDMLIVCSPVVPNIDEKKVVASALVMDIVYIPRETPFLKLAKSLGCEILYGEEMFFSQAAAQWNGWLV